MKTDKVSLLFGVHMHQPVDNFKEAVDHAVQSCYGPFFKTMSKFKDFHFSVHCSGWLLEKIRDDYPEVFADIFALAKAGSLEFFTAGFYEPVLCSIPSCDRVEQIQKLNSLIKKEFDVEPKGLWLTERVWESGLIPDVAKAGIKYGVVDDYHFICSGFDKNDLDGYYLSEESAEKIALFPISKSLRYALPFKPVKESIEAIKDCRKSKNGAAIIFDDAEKFGMWPGTHEWVYDKGWLESFVQEILDDEAIETMHYSHYYQSHRAKGIAYLQNVSYYEMGEWSLRADDALALERLKAQMGEEEYEREGIKFLKGGIWKNFFVKYDESNRLHKRMIECSKDRVKNRAYKEALLKLQTNDVFWHGVFGGLYLPNLRDNAYHYLVECENLKYKNSLVRQRSDTNMSGYDQEKVVSKDMIVRFDSRYGGQMIEFDDRKSCFNWQNVLTRRKEAYHKKLLENVSSERSDKNEDGISTIHNATHNVDETIKNALYFDWYVKNSFIDHISDHTLNISHFIQCSFKEFGDFANQPFELSEDNDTITFLRNGGIYDDQAYPATLKKVYRISGNSIDFELDLNTKSPHIYEYGMEFNLHFANLDQIKLSNKPLGDGLEMHELKTFSIQDPYTKRKLNFTTNHYFTFFASPLRTVSQSESGYDLMDQGVSLLLIFPFSKSLTILGTLEVVDV